MIINYWIFNGDTIELCESDSVSYNICTNYVAKYINGIDKKILKNKVNLLILGEINSELFRKLTLPSDVSERSGHPFFREERAIPTIFFGFEDFYNSDNENHNGKYDKNQQNELLWKKLGIPGCYNFFDSSIWCYYISLRDSNIQVRLEEVLNRINKNYENNLYNSYVAYEYLELNIRLASNSYISGSKAHANAVTPFVFHSETEMQRMLNKELKDKEESINKLEWNCLLIDDFADLPLSANNEKNEKTKIKLIENIIAKSNINIESFTENKSETIKHVKEGSNNEEIGESCIIWKTLQKLSNKTYDVLLLDYLLGKKSNNFSREFSDEMLILLDGILLRKIGYTSKNFCCIEPFMPREIKTADKIGIIENLIDGIFKHKGPLGMYWIFNISSFQTAFLNRLREQGLGHNSEHWILSSGADPINTPELFKYSFFSFLNLQLSQVIFTNSDIQSFLAQYRLLNNNRNKSNVRDWAKSLYGAFMYRFGKREVILKDNNNNSIFAKSVIKYLNDIVPIEEVTYYDHVRQFLFQLAYGTGYNISQTIELYYIVKQESSKETDLEYTFSIIRDYLDEMSKSY